MKKTRKVKGPGVGVLPVDPERWRAVLWWGKSWAQSWASLEVYYGVN